LCRDERYTLEDSEIPPHSILDEVEFMEVTDFPFDRSLEMVLESEIRDSMTIIAVLLADRMRRER